MCEFFAMLWHALIVLPSTWCSAAAQLPVASQGYECTVTAKVVVCAVMRRVSTMPPTLLPLGDAARPRSTGYQCKVRGPCSCQTHCMFYTQFFHCCQSWAHMPSGNQLAHVINPHFSISPWPMRLEAQRLDCRPPSTQLAAQLLRGSAYLQVC